MPSRHLVFELGVILSFVGQAQEPKATSPARELFYSVLVKKDAIPAQKAAATVKSPKGNATPSKSKSDPVTQPETGAKHLGLRYNLLLVDQSSGRSEAVDSDRLFRKGECFAINFQSNRAGYLYVFAKQTSGSWQLLLPSPQMASESNVIQPEKEFRVPSRYCFEIHDPPGTETLFVSLSRDPADIGALYEEIKGGSPAAPPVEPRRPATPVQVADARLVNDTVSRMKERFGTRDITIRRVSQPLSQDEPRGAVYVVNASDTPTSSVVTQVEVRHR